MDRHANHVVIFKIKYELLSSNFVNKLNFHVGTNISYVTVQIISMLRRYFMTKVIRKEGNVEDI